MILLYIFLLFVLIDIPVLYVLYQKFYRSMFASINGKDSPPPLRIALAGLFVYILMTAALYHFVLKDPLSTGKPSLSEVAWTGFFLGIVCYGIYDFTNLASITLYGAQEAVMDTLWGGILFAMVSVIIYSIYRPVSV